MTDKVWQQRCPQTVAGRTRTSSASSSSSRYRRRTGAPLVTAQSRRFHTHTHCYLRYFYCTGCTGLIASRCRHKAPATLRRQRPAPSSALPCSALHSTVQLPSSGRLNITNLHLSSAAQNLHSSFDSVVLCDHLARPRLDQRLAYRPVG